MSSFQTIPSVQNNKLLPSFQTYVRKQQKSQVKPEDDDSSSPSSIYGSIKSFFKRNIKIINATIVFIPIAVIVFNKFIEYDNRLTKLEQSELG